MTDKKNQFRNAFHDEREMHRIIFDNSAVSIMTADADERITSCNRFTESLLGITEAELIGKPVRSLYPDEEWKKIRSYNVRQKGMQHHLETRIIKKNGEQINIDISLSVLKDKEGNITGSIGVIRDITARKRLAQLNVAKRLDGLKADLMQTVSHELRTPMAVALEGVRQVYEGFHGDTTPEQKEYLSKSLGALHTLRDLVDNLLNVSKLESHKTLLKKERSDIVKITRAVSHHFTRHAEAKDLNIEESFPDHEIGVMVDPDEMIYVVKNLLGNAIRFTKKGRVAIQVIEHKTKVECCISDTGPGISEEDLPKVFTKFQQFGRTYGPGMKGMGLGLAICKRIVELHKGRISVSSKVGEGSKFTFALPKM
jgi:PAS domain S-box-containing protein